MVNLYKCCCNGQGLRKTPQLTKQTKDEPENLNHPITKKMNHLFENSFLNSSPQCFSKFYQTFKEGILQFHTNISQEWGGETLDFLTLIM